MTVRIRVRNPKRNCRVTLSVTSEPNFAALGLITSELNFAALGLVTVLYTNPSHRNPNLINTIEREYKQCHLYTSKARNINFLFRYLFNN